jgi:hypothetical protein
MLPLGWFHRSTTDTVVEGCGRNSAGSAFFGDWSLNERPGVWSAATIGCNSMFVWDVLFEGREVFDGFSVTVLVDDIVIPELCSEKDSTQAAGDERLF